MIDGLHAARCRRPGTGAFGKQQLHVRSFLYNVADTHLIGFLYMQLWRAQDTGEPKGAPIVS